MHHAVVVGLGVEEGNGGWEAELADYVKREFFDKCWCGAVPPFDSVLFGWDGVDGVGLMLEAAGVDLVPSVHITFLEDNSPCVFGVFGVFSLADCECDRYSPSFGRVTAHIGDREHGGPYVAEVGVGGHGFVDSVVSS